MASSMDDPVVAHLETGALVVDVSSLRWSMGKACVKNGPSLGQILGWAGGVG
jgi:hypothetical protein